MVESSARREGANGGSPIAIVTGAGSGIGRETARQLDEAGWRVVLAGRRAGPLEQTAETMRNRPIVAPTDVADPDAVLALVRRAAAAAAEDGVRYSLLVNNAGLAPLLDIDRTDPATIRDVFDVNAIGPAVAIHASWPIFKEQQGGCIVNISTLGTDDPFPGFFAYAAAKASVNLMTKSCANEGAAHNIRAYAIAPGAVETPMLRALFPESSLPKSVTIDPADVARVVVECARGRRESDNGGVIWMRNPD